MNTIPAGTAVDVENPYGRQLLVLRRGVEDTPDVYRTGLVVSTSWNGPTFRTEGRVRRA